MQLITYNTSKKMDLNTWRRLGGLHSQEDAATYSLYILFFFLIIALKWINHRTFFDKMDKSSYLL